MQPENVYQSHFCNNNNDSGICRSKNRKTRQAITAAVNLGLLRHGLCIFNADKKYS